MGPGVGDGGREVAWIGRKPSPAVLDPAPANGAVSKTHMKTGGSCLDCTKPCEKIEFTVGHDDLGVL